MVRGDGDTHAVKMVVMDDCNDDSKDEDDTTTTIIFVVLPLDMFMSAASI